jgi:hypothetical protein
MDRDWLALMPEDALEHVKFSQPSTFTLELSTVAMMEEVLGAMEDTCRTQAGTAGDTYVLEKRPGRNSNRGDIFYFHIYAPAYIHYSPEHADGDTVCMSCHAARIHHGHVLWSTRAE